MKNNIRQLVITQRKFSNKVLNREAILDNHKLVISPKKGSRARKDDANVEYFGFSVRTTKDRLQDSQTVSDLIKWAKARIIFPDMESGEYEMHLVDNRGKRVVGNTELKTVRKTGSKVKRPYDKELEEQDREDAYEGLALALNEGGIDTDEMTFDDLQTIHLSLKAALNSPKLLIRFAEYYQRSMGETKDDGLG